MVVACTNGGSTARSGQIQVNGGSAVGYSCPTTGSFSTPIDVTVVLALAAGTNALTFTGTSSAPNLDAVTVPGSVG